MSNVLDVSSPLRRAWLRELGIERVWPASGQARTEEKGAHGSAATSAAATVPADMRTQGAPVPTANDANDANDAAPAPRAAFATPVATQPAAGNAHAASLQQAAPPPAAAEPSRPAGARVGGPAQRYRETLANMAAAPRAGTPPPVTQAEAMSWTSGDPDADWAALQQEVSVCTACALSRTRTNAVFGSGPRNAPWLLIGEGPGEQEDRQGVPFVGRSGQLLQNMLGAIGVQRAEGDVFVTNIVKCRPPGNRNPEPEEAAACRPYLERQVALLAPTRALVVGRVAAQNVLGTDATIGSLRGRVHRLTLGGKDIPMVVSYHPAYLLRAPLEKSKAWHDLRRVSGIDESQ
jgi:DNA polymerase